MEIKNEEHAAEMLDQWRQLPDQARKAQIKLAIEKLELSAMYYEQKDNDQGARRCERSILILKENLETIGK